MDESLGKSEFSIRLTFGVRNTNLMRAFQPRFVIRAAGREFIHTQHSTEGQGGRWSHTLCSEWGMKASVSMLDHHTVAYKWYRHQALHRRLREFHSSKLHYLDRPESIMWGWEEEGGCQHQAEAITVQIAAGMQVSGCHYTWTLHILSSFLISLQKLQVYTGASTACLLRADRLQWTMREYM